MFSSNEGPKTAKGVSYVVNFKKDHWFSKKDSRSDYVFENDMDGRIVLSNSFCNEFQDQPLNQLAEKTFKAVKQFGPVVEKFTTFQDREAYRMEGAGEVDGVRVFIRLLNTRRNNCYYDFVSITPSNAQKAQPIFDEFLSSVVFK